MTKAKGKPVLMRRVNLLWYPLTLIPLLALAYFSFAGALPPMMGLLSLFLLIFWVFSFGFALYETFRKRPDLRQ